MPPHPIVADTTLPILQSERYAFAIDMPSWHATSDRPAARSPSPLRPSRRRPHGGSLLTMADRPVFCPAPAIPTYINRSTGEPCLQVLCSRCSFLELRKTSPHLQCSCHTTRGGEGVVSVSTPWARPRTESVPR